MIHSVKKDKIICTWYCMRLSNFIASRFRSIYRQKENIQTYCWKLERMEKTLLYFFFQLLLPWRWEKKGRKTKNECGRNCMVRKYVPVSWSLWAGNARRTAFPFQSFFWVTCIGHHLCEHQIHRTVWIWRALKVNLIPTSLHEQGCYLLIRLLKTPSSLALNTSSKSEIT